MSYQQVVNLFRAEKTNYSKLLMDLKPPITPKNDDGSIDHRYQSISKQIFRTLAGKVIANTYQYIPNGYQLLYTNPTLPGMSGGPVLDRQGGLAGIHGQAEVDIALTQHENIAVKTGTNQAIPVSYLPVISTDMERIEQDPMIDV